LIAGMSPGRFDLASTSPRDKGRICQAPALRPGSLLKFADLAALKTAEREGPAATTCR
jgi:hypothetical protein